jgi:hypothetical protein
MPETSFTRLRAKPYPTQPSEKLRLALAEHGIDADGLWRKDIARASLARDTPDGEVLLQLSNPESPDGIDGFRTLIGALVAAGASVYAYCDPGADYPAAAESHALGREPARLTWRDGGPALDEETLRFAAREGAADQRPLAQLPDGLVGAAAKHLFAAFAAAP